MMARLMRIAAALLLAALLGACGGGGGGGSTSPSTGTPTGGAGGTGTGGPGNVVALTVQSFTSAALSAPNVPYVTVTVCNGSGQCATIPNVMLDTGSSGLRLFSGSVAALNLPTETVGSSQLASCAKFASGYLWGGMRLATVQIGSIATTRAVPIEVINDPLITAAAPRGCRGSSGGDFSGQLAQVANGLLGVSNFLADCGSACVTNPNAGMYYACSLSACSGTTVALSDQGGNPIAAMPAGYNNGGIITLPAVATGGAPSASGTFALGIGTQANNTLPAGAQSFTLDSYGDLGVAVNGVGGTGFLDSGSNGYFLALGLPVCSDGVFYCPNTTSTFALQLTAGTTAASATMPIGNANAMFSSGNMALPALGGTAALAGYVDLGLPFFYGRAVATGLPTTTYPNGFVAF